MLAVGVAVPVFVALETHGLIGLIADQLVGAVGKSGLNAGVVGVGVNTVFFLNAGVVQVGLNQPAGTQVVQQLEAGQGLGQNQGDLIITGLVQADGVVADIIGVGPVDEDLIADPALDLVVSNSGLQELVGHEVELAEVHDAQRGFHRLVGLGSYKAFHFDFVAAGPGIVFEVILYAEGVGPVDAALGFGVLVDDSLKGIQAFVGHNGIQGELLGLTLVGVELSAGDAEVADVLISCTVVQQLRIQQTLHGLNVGIGVDGGAILPGSQRVEVDGVSETGSSGLGNTEFGVVSPNLFRNVHRLSSSHLGDDYIAGVGILAFKRMKLIVENKGVQALRDILRRIIIISGHKSVGVPVGCESHNGILIGVIAFELDNLVSRFGCGGGAVAFGSSSGGLSGLLGCTACKDRQSQQCSKQQCKCLLHFLYLLKYIYIKNHWVFI